MKMQTTLFVAVALMGSAQQPGNAQNPPKAGEARKAAAADSKPMAVGIVQKLDSAGSTITIAHGPVAALQWPAMTMTFKASPQQLASVKAGQKVKFEFKVAGGMNATVTRISPQP